MAINKYGERFKTRAANKYFFAMLKSTEMLARLMERKGLTQTQLAQQIGIRPSSVNQWLSGHTTPGKKNLQALAQLLGVTISDLLVMRISDEQSGGVAAEFEEGIEFVSGNIRSIEGEHAGLYYQLPFLSARAQAGNPEFNFEGCQLRTDEMYIVPLDIAVRDRHRSIVIEVVGESMAPQISDGAKVVAERVPKNDYQFVDGGVFAVLFANRFVVKRIRNNDLRMRGTLTLLSDNPEFGAIAVMIDELQCIWRVTHSLSNKIR